MLLLILGLVLFLGIHLVPANASLRDGLVERVGRPAWMVVFSLISLAGLVIAVQGYQKLRVDAGKNPILWDPPVWTSHLALLLMLPVFTLLIATYVPSRIKRIVKHPMLLAIKFWAFAHLLANGDLASMVLFGSFLAYAIVDRISMKYRPAPANLGPAPPLVNDLACVVLGLGIYVAFVLWLHAAWIGVAPIIVSS